MEAFYHFLHKADAALFCFINSHHSVVFDYFFLVITQLGNGWVVVPLAGLIIALATPRKYLARALVYAAIAGTFAGIVNTQVKRAVHSQRPIVCFAAQSGGAAAYKVHVVGKPLRHNSFPSGHTSTAFTAATILALLYGGYFYWAFAPALLVAYSRVYVGAHFPLDILGGMVMGAGIGLVFFLLFRQFGYVSFPLPLRRAGAQQ